MRRGELGVEQAKSAGVEPRDQMNQRHLAGIALAREHRLAEKGPTEPDAIEPADQTPMSPGFDRVAAAEPVELRVQRADAAIDPGVRPPERLGAAVDDLAEFRVDPDLVGGAADRLAQAATDMELIEEAPRAPPAPPNRGRCPRRSRPSGRCRRHRRAAASAV